MHPMNVPRSLCPVVRPAGRRHVLAVANVKYGCSDRFDTLLSFPWSVSPLVGILNSKEVAFFEDSP